MPRNDPVQVIQNFMGLNNVSAPEELDEKEFVQASDVDFTDRGRAIARTGFVPIEELGKVTDVGGSDDAVLFVRSGDLYTVSGSGPELVRAGLQGSDRMSYAPAGGAIYYTNGMDRGCVANAKEVGWGQEPHPDSLGLSVSAGSGLQPGIYQISIVAVSSAGEESPPTRIVSVEAASGSSIVISGIDAPASAAALRLYCSQPNGSVLHMVEEIPVASTSHTLFPTVFGQALETVGCISPPHGNLLCFFRGRLFIGSGSVVWYTYPYRLGCVDPTRNFLHFTSDVLAMLPTDKGIFMCCEGGVYFVRGTTPDVFEYEERGSYPIIPGTQTRIPSERFKDGDGIDEDVWVWLSGRGFHAGTADGEVLDLTEGRVDVDAGVEGAGVFLERQGASMYIGTVKDPGDDKSTFGFGDRVVAEVYRNGVPV